MISSDSEVEDQDQNDNKDQLDNTQEDFEDNNNQEDNQEDNHINHPPGEEDNIEPYDNVNDNEEDLTPPSSSSVPLCQPNPNAPAPHPILKKPSSSSSSSKTGRQKKQLKPPPNENGEFGESDNSGLCCCCWFLWGRPAVHETKPKISPSDQSNFNNQNPDQNLHSPSSTTTNNSRRNSENSIIINIMARKKSVTYSEQDPQVLATYSAQEYERTTDFGEKRESGPGTEMTSRGFKMPARYGEYSDDSLDKWVGLWGS